MAITSWKRSEEMYRFIICVDVAAENLEAAYRELLARMGEVDIDELRETRMRVLVA